MNVSVADAVDGLVDLSDAVGRLLGTGTFSAVYEGRWKGKPVAITYSTPANLDRVLEVASRISESLADPNDIIAYPYEVVEQPPPPPVPIEPQTKGVRWADLDRTRAAISTLYEGTLEDTAIRYLLVEADIDRLCRQLHRIVAFLADQCGYCQADLLPRNIVYRRMEGGRFDFAMIDLGLGGVVELDGALPDPFPCMDIVPRLGVHDFLLSHCPVCRQYYNPPARPYSLPTPVRNGSRRPLPL